MDSADDHREAHRDKGTLRDPASIPGFIANFPVAMTIAGSDSSGGAGIQADIKTFEALGCFGTSAITAITAQNTTGVKSIQGIDAEIVRDQIDMVVNDFGPVATKTGMIATPSLIETVASAIRHHDLTVVVDPVMIATSGARLIEEEAIRSLKSDLIPLARLITPNRMEAETLTGNKIKNREDAERAARELLELGPQAVLLKGGHLHDPEDEVIDILATPDRTTHYGKPRIDTQSTHGTGCTLAAAITAGLAKGLLLEDAIRDAERLIEYGLQHGYRLGLGPSPVHHLAQLRNDAARHQVLAALRDTRDHILHMPRAARLIAEVGMNIAIATPYAIATHDIAALEGRITRANTPNGMRPHHVGGMSFGASRHMARLLLTLRRFDPQVGAVMNIRHDAAILAAIRELGWDVVEADRRNEPEESRVREGSSMDWAARYAMRDRTQAPEAITDPGESGKEPMVRLIGRGPQEIRTMLDRLASHLGD